MAISTLVIRVYSHYSIDDGISDGLNELLQTLFFPFVAMYYDADRRFRVFLPTFALACALLTLVFFHCNIFQDTIAPHLFMGAVGVMGVKYSMERWHRPAPSIIK